MSTVAKIFAGAGRATSRFLAVLCLTAGWMTAAEEKDEPSALSRARAAEKEGRLAQALSLAEKAVSEKKDAESLRLLARLCEANRRYAGAVTAYTGLMELAPAEPALLNRRGMARFMSGDFEGSVKDFDAYLEKMPERMPSHWQRGLAQYGAGLFAQGRAQFEAHQKVNAHDVENAAWHFICVARLEGVEAARKALIPIRGDRRVPMAQIHELFAGSGTESAVIEAASKEGEGRRNHLCYAHLYLALYKEALDKPGEALKHYKLAAEDYGMSHYMGETARIFYQSRKKNTADEAVP